MSCNAHVYALHRWQAVPKHKHPFKRLYTARRPLSDVTRAKAMFGACRKNNGIRKAVSTAKYDTYVDTFNTSIPLVAHDLSAKLAKHRHIAGVIYSLAQQCSSPRREIKEIQRAGQISCAFLLRDPWALEISVRRHYMYRPYAVNHCFIR